jgi:hypothetical protein
MTPARPAASEDGPGAENQRAKGLLDSSTITAAEFDSIKTKAVA